MPEGPIIVTDADMDRLTRIVQASKHSLFRDQQQVDLLDQTLAGAEVRPLERVPRGLIGMNSCVRVFDFDSRRTEIYTLAFPDEADISRGMISVLAPLGIALLGRRKGDIIRARVPGGTRRLRLEGVRQHPDRKSTMPAEASLTRLTAQLRRNHETALAV